MLVTKRAQASRKNKSTKNRFGKKVGKVKVLKNKKISSNN